MTEEQIRQKFWQLVDKAQNEWNRIHDDLVIEPILVELLNFVKQHPESKGILEQCFIDLIQVKKRVIGVDILEFCMYDLRWPKIKEVVVDIVRNAEDIRVRDALGKIRDAYDDDWDGIEFYPYYYDRQ